MEIAETLKCIRIYVSTARILGVVDAKFDNRTQRIKQVDTRFHTARHACTLFYITLLRCAMIFSFIQSIVTGNFTLKDKFDILHLSICLISLYTLRLGIIGSITSKGVRFHQPLTRFFHSTNNLKVRYLLVQNTTNAPKI